MLRSASSTGLPTTAIRSAGTPSASRNRRASSVGARCSAHVAAATRRLTSSIEVGLNERSPASRWTTGTSWLRAARQYAGTVWVSPSTSTASGATARRPRDGPA